MTSPRHAESTAQGRYYTHPKTGQKLISVTNALSVAVAKPALVPWAAKATAEAAVDALPRLIATSRDADDCRTKRGSRARASDDCLVCHACVIREIKRAPAIVRDKASDLGSRIHELAEAHALGRSIAWEDGDDEAEPFVKQYRRFLADYDVDLARDFESAELTVAHPSAGYAGTLDILARLKLDGYIAGQGVKPTAEGEPRGLWLIDIKTSKTRPSTSVYGENALQLTALRDATEMWLPDDTIARFDLPIVGAAVLNLRASTYELIPVPSGTPERNAWRGVLATAHWMHAVGEGIEKGEHRPVTPTGQSKAKATRATRGTKAKGAA